MEMSFDLVDQMLPVEDHGDVALLGEIHADTSVLHFPSNAQNGARAMFDDMLDDHDWLADARGVEVVDNHADQRQSPANEIPTGRLPSRSVEPRGALTKIGGMLHRVAFDLLDNDRDPSIVLPAPPAEGNRTCSRPRHQTKVSFPGKTPSEAWRFTVILRLLEVMHEAMSAQVIVTKRDMYYRDPALFGSQAVVDRHVDLISASLQISRSQLHVTAAAKGLMAGALSICRRDGTTFNLATRPEPSLISQPDEILSVNVELIAWVLVIEKEATFQSVLTSDFWAAYHSQGIVITGKGYPDVATRALLHLLTVPSSRNLFHSPPTFGLVDFDPDGLSILSTYKNGSAAMQAENYRLTAPSIRRLGLSSGDLALGSGETHRTQGLLPLTVRDRKKATDMLAGNGRPAGGGPQDAGLEDSWRRELQVMLLLNYKAELQILDAVAGGLQNLLYRGLPLRDV